MLVYFSASARELDRTIETYRAIVRAVQQSASGLDRRMVIIEEYAPPTLDSVLARTLREVKR